MNIISWIILGALAGWIASIITKTNESQGAIGNILTGVVGAFIGGFLLDLFTRGDTASSFNFATLITATVGAVILISIMKAVRRPHRA
ncbi:GlsB/YeaQ/YmgE family stress response membrane protein [Polaromonas sp.]|nr:GlsB/YeaQ/YmgE family stress response membrane protein [Candidatus Saccharibacteria bacterium]